MRSVNKKKLLLVLFVIGTAMLVLFWSDLFGGEDEAVAGGGPALTTQIITPPNAQYPAVGAAPRATPPAAANPAAPAPAASAASGGPRTYTVQAGDTASEIVARVLKTSFPAGMKQLQALNPTIANWDRLSVGQQLVLPPLTAAPAAPQPPRPDQNPAVGNPALATPAPSGGEERWYVVQPGDSLAYIARKFGLKSYQQIVDANPALAGNPHSVRDGMRLHIPR